MEKINKIVLPDQDIEEYRGTVLALLRNGYIVHVFRILVQNDGSHWERWIYYCRLELLGDLQALIDSHENGSQYRPVADGD